MMTLQQALSYYLTDPTETPGTTKDDLIMAGRTAKRWRVRGPEATATILHALYVDHHMTFADIERETGIDDSTVQRLVRDLRSGKWSSHR